MILDTPIRREVVRATKSDAMFELVVMIAVFVAAVLFQSQSFSMFGIAMGMGFAATRYVRAARSMR